MQPLWLPHTADLLAFGTQEILIFRSNGKTFLNQFLYRASFLTQLVRQRRFMRIPFKLR